MPWVADAHRGSVQDRARWVPEIAAPRPGGRTGRERKRRKDGGPDRIRTGDLQRDRLACWAATPRVLGRWRMIAGTPRPSPPRRRDLQLRRATGPRRRYCRRRPTRGSGPEHPMTYDRRERASPGDALDTARGAGPRAGRAGRCCATGCRRSRPRRSGGARSRSASSACRCRLAIGSWPALAPFIVGLVIAYAVLPIANRLDRFMPRFLAALLAELVALAVLVGVRPARGAAAAPRRRCTVALALPTPAQIQAGLADFQDAARAAAGSARRHRRSPSRPRRRATSRRRCRGSSQGAGAFVASQILGIAGTLSFVLGLLVIPVWVLTLVADERQLKGNVADMFAPAVRPDVVGAVAGSSTACSAPSCASRCVLAIVVGFLIWLGLTIAQELGIAEFRYAVTGGDVLLGVLQLIPELGFFLGFFPILLVLAIGGPVPAATALVRVPRGLPDRRTPSWRRACRGASSTSIPRCSSRPSWSSPSSAGCGCSPRRRSS